MNQEAVEALLRQKIGLEPSTIGSRKIARAVESRRLACGLSDWPSYLERLQTSRQELLQLIEQIVVPETWFFRHRESFNFLNRYVKSKGFGTHANSTLQVLSVACSTGEEPYSIAMSLTEAGLTPNNFQIDAIDISEQALLKAKKAVYNNNSFRSDCTPEKQRYFQPVADGYQLCPSIRNTVNFRQQNLLEPLFRPQKQYHVIFCRHLLIYFEADARSRAMEVLDRLLMVHGLLLVGAVETRLFKMPHLVTVHYPHAFGYQKVEAKSATVIKKHEKKCQPLYSLTLKEAEKHEELRDGAFKDSLRAAVTAPPGVSFFPVEERRKVTSEDLSRQTHQQPRSLLDRASHLANRGQLNEAAYLCQTYLNQNPIESQAYRLLGEIHQAKGEETQAEQYFLKAIYLNPKSDEALLHLALLKESRGDLTGAAVIKQRIQRLYQI